MRMRVSPVVVMIAIVMPLLACDGGTSPAMLTMQLSNAQVLVGGTSVGGQTMSIGHGGGAVTRFEARLLGDAATRAGQVVRVRYQRPGMMMMNGASEFQLYDDGTHGDRHAGDGLYCFEDAGNAYGCGGYGTGPGQYRYEFCAYGNGAPSSNTQVVVVTLE